MFRWSTFSLSQFYICMFCVYTLSSMHYFCFISQVLACRFLSSLNLRHFQFPLWLFHWPTGYRHTQFLVSNLITFWSSFWFPQCSDSTLNGKDVLPRSVHSAVSGCIFLHSPFSSSLLITFRSSINLMAYAVSYTERRMLVCKCGFLKDLWFPINFSHSYFKAMFRGCEHRMHMLPSDQPALSSASRLCLVFVLLPSSILLFSIFLYPYFLTALLR